MTTAKDAGQVLVDLGNALMVDMLYGKNSLIKIEVVTDVKRTDEKAIHRFNYWFDPSDLRIRSNLKRDIESNARANRLHPGQ